MDRSVKAMSDEAKDILRALRRAARKALELGIQTGTPVYVMKNGKIVDLTKDKIATKKLRFEAHQEIEGRSLTQPPINLATDYTDGRGRKFSGTFRLPVRLI